MAVELCKVNLWMEALEPGRPLSFLEHHIQCGNALLGTTPALLAEGIPDAAFIPLEGDDREACSKWKRVNKAERASRAKKQARFDFDAPWMKIGKIAESILAVDILGDESIERIHEKERLYEQAVRSGDYLHGRFLADAWCAAFVWKKTSLTDYPITEDIFRQIELNPTAFHNDQRAMTAEIQGLARQYQFVHWHLNFPGVFRPAPAADEADNKVTGWNGGFDVVLGNPPWERVKLQEREWFAARRPDITAAPNAAARRRMIEALETEDPALTGRISRGSPPSGRRKLSPSKFRTLPTLRQGRHQYVCGFCGDQSITPRTGRQSGLYCPVGYRDRQHHQGVLRRPDQHEYTGQPVRL